MSDSDSEDLDAIREQKREEIIQQVTGEDTVSEVDAPTDPIHIEGADHLGDVTRRHDVVLVDFHADWCGPCQMLEPVVKQLARDTAAVVAKVDIDHHQGIARQANVRGVPTLLLYADGEPVERLVGVQDEGTLRDLIDKYA